MLSYINKQRIPDQINISHRINNIARTGLTPPAVDECISTTNGNDTKITNRERESDRQTDTSYALQRNRQEVRDFLSIC